MVPGAVSTINPSVELEKQELSEKTKSLLATLALTYWAESANDRWELASKLHANELKYQEKPEAAMTQEEYQDLLSAFDDWNELFGPIPFWAVSRRWYPMECYEIVAEGEEADIWAGKTGLKLAIGSSSKNTPFILERIGLSSFFDAVADGNCITHSKPHPEVFLKAAEMIGLQPSDCLVVEDAHAGVQAAVSGGFDCAAMGDARDDERASWHLYRFSDLLKCLL